MNDDQLALALRAAARALGLGMWRLDLDGLATWDTVGAKLLGQTKPETAEQFIAWLHSKVGGDSMPRWSEDEEWVSSAILYRSPQGPRYLCFAGRRDGRTWSGSIQDITKDKILRQRVAEAERMEEIGRFSSGVAHNFNNMLAIITVCLADTETRLSEQNIADGEVLRNVRDAQDAAARAALVTENLARLVRPDEKRTDVCDVQKLCVDAIEGLRRVAVDGLEIVHSFSPELFVRQAPGVLEQVLNNLLVNANYALRFTDNPTVWLNGTRSDAFGAETLMLVVGDNGPGIPPELEPHLFQPFVSTKGKDGTGLGLATASESLRRIDGQLVYRAREGGGAEFVITLPLVPRPTEVEAGPAPGKDAGRGLAGRHVLVVDDEPVIRRVIQRILEQEGATVAAAGDLSSARKLLSPAPDAVLLDQTLGRDRGLDLLPDLRSVAPHARVLFFSGEPVGPAETSLVDGVVAKPVRAQALIEAIRQVLT